MIMNLVINFIRRQRVPLLALTILLLVVYIFTSRRIFGGQVVTQQASLEEGYCNSPHKVDGEETETIDGLKLVQVQMLIRHGDRAPINLKSLPNTSPVYISCRFNNTNEKFQRLLQTYKDAVKSKHFKVTGSAATSLLEERSQCHGGQLTPLGMLQHLYLGSHLRESFSSFLEKIDVSKDVHVLSTDLPRTKQSAAALLTGMLGKKLTSEISINVHKDHLADTHLVLDENEDPIDCPVFTKKFKELLEGPKFDDFNKNTRSLIENIAYYLSTDVSKLPKFNRILDTFYTRDCHNLGIAAGPNHRLPKSLIKQAYGFSHVYSRLRHSGEIAELQALSLFSQIGKHAVMALKTESEGKKIVLYSGHDSMIHPFLQVLDEKFTNWPPYAARILFEVYTEETASFANKNIIEKSYFRVLYNGKPMDRIKFIGNAEGRLKLFRLSSLLRHLSNEMENFDEYEPGVLSGFVFNRIKTKCIVDSV